MKKLLLSSVVLLLSAISIMIFQLSCTKISEAQNNNNLPGDNVNSILYVDLNPETFYAELRAVRLDGTNDHKINVALPADWLLAPNSTARVLSGNHKIVFTAYTADAEGQQQMGFFSCNADGSDVQLIKSKNYPANFNIELRIQDIYNSASSN